LDCCACTHMHRITSAWRHSKRFTDGLQLI
jgi:hypothetical protein